MTKLTETQTLILTRAAVRPGNLALPLPKGLAGAAARMAIGKMIERGWIEEVEANLRQGEPLWRETGDGHGTTLIATEAGLEAIGIEPVVAATVTALRKRAVPTSIPGARGTPVVTRSGTKQAQVIDLLKRPEGATISEICAATGWQAHSARGAISGGLRKKLGFDITTAADDERGRVYHIHEAR